MVPARSGLGLALGMMIMLLCGGIAKAQFHQPSEVTVRMGEMLPESFFQSLHQAVDMQTGEKTTLRLEDYRDKLIILDFWATWCSPCIYSLNNLDSLIRHDGDGRYIVIPVTYQSIDEASRAYEKYGWHFNGIVDDTTLGKIFPHSGIPHMVWVKDGKVISMPQAAYVTRRSIAAALEGRATDMPQQLKKVNTSQPVLSVSNQGYQGALFYQSSIIGGDPAYGQLGLEITEQDGCFVLTLCNMPMFAGLLYEAFRSELPADVSRKGSIVWDMDSISKAGYTASRPRKADFTDIGNYREAYEAWVARYMYTYSLKMPAAMGREALYRVMQQDLCRFVAAHLGLEVTLEHRPEARLIIRKSQS